MAASTPLALAVFLLYVLLSSSASLPAQAQVVVVPPAKANLGPTLNPSQHLVLKQLYAQWGNFTNATTWRKPKVPQRCSKYVGIQCSRAGYIVNMSLPWVGIKGPVGALSKLVTLRFLNLQGARLNGSKVGIAALTRLERLDLSWNPQFKVLPRQFSALTKLSFLDLTNTLLTGPIPDFLGLLTSLTYLSISRNPFAGSIPGSLGNLKRLLYLGISQSGANGLGISGGLPNTLSQLVQLRDLQLDGNSLQGAIPEYLGTFTGLSVLLLSQNQFSAGPIPQSLRNLKGLVSLGLWQTNRNGRIPPYIGTLSNLVSLWLSDNDLEGSVPTTITNLKNLQELGLQSNRLWGSFPSIKKMTSLNRLNVANNFLTGRFPFTVPRSIRFIDISFNYFYGNPQLYYPWGKRVCREASSWYTTIGNCLQFPRNYGNCSTVSVQRSAARCAAFCGTRFAGGGQCRGVKNGVCIPSGFFASGLPKGFTCSINPARSAQQ